MNEAQTRKDLIDPAIEKAGSEFLCLDAAKDVFLEIPRSAEELVFGLRHGELVRELLFLSKNKSDGNRFSSLQAKNILRFSVIPSFRKTSPIIVANLDRVCKWGDEKRMSWCRCPDIRLGGRAA